MSLDELNQRIKDEVVLREGDLFEWQWQQLGLPAEAEALGVPADEFLGLVNEVSRAINPYFGRISDLKVKVTDLARLQRKKLTTAQVDQIVADAARLQLGPAFVTGRWLPSILAALPEPPADTETVVPVPATTPAPEPTPVSSPAITATPPVQPQQPIQPVPPRPVAQPATPDRAAVMQKVHQFLDEYKADQHIPASVLKPLFLATNFDEALLADAVLAYLSANFYAAETPVRGELLKDKLLSANWRHLSWWAATPVSTVVSPTLPQPVRPAQRGSSDSRVIGMAVLAVGLLVGAVWWVTGKTTETPAPKVLMSTVKPSDTVTAPIKKKSRRKTRTSQH